MKADSLRISKVFSSGGDVHYILPHFQREYAWDRSNWQTLLSDVLSVYEAYNPDKEPEHFMGALVVINDGTRNGTVPAFKLVDGQQRLTTISLVLCALGHIVEESHPNLYRKIQRLLTNTDEIGLLYFKLLPTKKYGDLGAYRAIIEGKSLPSDSESRIPEAFDYFYKELRVKILKNQLEPERLFIVLTNCLQVVFIDLDQKERPYEIFESLNAKNKPLTQADLVRNYIAMRLPIAQQEQVFEEQWSKIESLLQERRTVGRSRFGEMTAFLRHYLAFRTGLLPNQDHVYARFRDRMEKDVSSEGFIEEIDTLCRFAIYYNYLLRSENEKDEDIQIRLSRLNVLEISTAYPFLMVMYDALEQNTINRDEFLEGLDILENYLVRRYLAGEPSNYLNKMFPTLWREVKQRCAVNKLAFPEGLVQVILTKNYPSDNRIQQLLLREQLYDRSSQSRNKVCLILESVNTHLSRGSDGYTVLNSEPTIEHIMPQSPTKEWKADLGSNLEQVYNEFLHTLGNLTLVTQEWNSTLSNAAFATKRHKLASHALRLNSQYFSAEIPQWNEKAILERANFLIFQILEIWSSLGEPPVSQADRKPKLLEILGETYEVGSWRDVAYYAAQCVLEVVDNFDAIAQQMPTYFSREEKKRHWELNNGWWLKFDLTANSALNFCDSLLLAAEIPNDDWKIEFE